MRLEIDVDFQYDFADLTDVMIQIEAAHGPDQRIVHDDLDLSDASHFARVTAEEDIGARIWVRAEGSLNCRYRACVDIARETPPLDGLDQVPPHAIPGNAIRYLMGSRYCPADEFQNFAAAEFGHLAGGARIAAIRDWIEARFAYVPGASNAQTTALDTFVQRQGICRDFAHVLITLARASTIPARMASVYARDVEPPDFHAVAEVYLDGAWHLVDPSGMAGPEQMVRIGVGRDAADVAFLTSFGPATFVSQNVRVREADAA